MTQAAGTGSAASSTPGQSQAAVTTDWQAEAERLKADLAERDRQIRGTTQKLQAWERNVGGELGDLVERDNYGNPIRLKVDNGNQRPVYAGQHPLAGIVDNPDALDQHYEQQFGGRFLSPAQAQEMVNRAKTEAYQASRQELLTMRTVDRTVMAQKELEKYDSPLSKKTAEVLSRNQWGTPFSAQSKGWDEWQYAAPNALPLATQIANAELYQESQRSQQSQVQAAQQQQAAGISGSGAAAGSTPGRTPDEMAKMLVENPAEAEKIMKAEFDRVAAPGR